MRQGYQQQETSEETETFASRFDTNSLPSGGGEYQDITETHLVRFIVYNVYSVLFIIQKWRHEKKGKSL